MHEKTLTLNMNGLSFNLINAKSLQLMLLKLVFTAAKGILVKLESDRITGSF